MTLDPVESSNIKAIGHDPATNVLRVQFRSGATHDYHGVTREQHQALIGADSIGGHFHRHIRQQHPNTRLP